MSRTYHHGDRAKRRRFPAYHYCGAYPALPTPPKRPRASMPWFWLRGTPGAWNYTMHTRPWRARGRAELHYALDDVQVGNPDWGCVDDYLPAHCACAPGAYRRPHIYYW